LRALDQYLDGAVGELEQLQYARKRADLVDRLRCRIIVGGVLLGREQDEGVGPHHLFEREDRLLTSDEEGRDHVRKYDNVAQRQHRIDSGFTWRKRWAWLCSGHGPKSVLLSPCLLKSSSAAELLVITDPNADRSVDREFDFLGSHVDVLSAVHLHPDERPSAASRSIRPLKLWAAVNPRSAPAPWPASPLLRRRAPDRHGRGVDYSIALVERLSAFFIMLIGFEWVRPRLTPGT